MSTIPDRKEARFLRGLYEGNPVVAMAEAAIRAFHAEDVETAALLLDMWQHTPSLSTRERRAVLARFIEDQS